MNPEIAKLGAEIQQLRLKLTNAQEGYKTSIHSKREKESGYEDKMKQLRAEFDRQVAELMDLKRQLQDQLNQFSVDMRALERELEEKNALYAKMLEAENEQAVLEELKKTLDEICVDFPAYFKAHVYQHEDISFTIHAYMSGRNGILNANDLGLGKTFESAVTLYILAELFKQEYGRKPRILWLTKKSLVSSSPREIREWWPECKIASPMKTTITEKQREFTLEMYLMMGDIFLANYEFVRTTKLARNIDWDFVVIDEVHKLKGGANSNGPTAIWEAVRDVCKQARFTIMLSGTPMVNRAEEMWSYLHIFSPERFPTIRKFEQDYTSMQKIAGEMKYAINAEKLLTGALKGQMIRRSRKEVGLQLPELTREIRQLEMNPEQSKVYQQMRNNFFVWLDSNQTKPLTATAIIAQLTRLRQINVWPAGIKIVDPETEQEFTLDVEDSSKVDECMDIIETAQDQVVVFCTFNEPLQEVKRRAIKMGLTCEVINGTTVNKMGEFEKRFQEGNLDVLCINSAMGEGLNLQKNPNKWEGGSAVAVFLDLWWSPARNEQCEGRVHRQGANQPVNVYILENDPSIDAFIMGKLLDKQASFASIMDSQQIRPASEWRDYLEGVI